MSFVSLLGKFIYQNIKLHWNFIHKSEHKKNPTTCNEKPQIILKTRIYQEFVFVVESFKQKILI